MKCENLKDKKILVLASSYPDKNSNSSIFIHNQVKALIKNGFEVRVMHVDLRSARRLRKWGIYKTIYDEVVVYKASFPCGPIQSLLKIVGEVMAKRCSKYVKNDWDKVDIIHAHFYNAGRLSNIVQKKLGGKKVLTEHASYVLRENRTERVAKEAESVYCVQDKLLAVGETLRESMMDMTDKEIEILPNILMERFNVLNDEKYEKFTFISIGYLKKRKRFDLTIRAFREFKNYYKDSELLIVGDGAERKNLENLIIELELQDGVKLLGSIKNEKLPILYNKCHCFVLPSSFETFGVVYIEALACGLPAIGTRCGGPNDIINNKNGILINVDEEKELINAMLRVKGKYYQYNASAISNEIINAYGEETFIERISSIYNDL